ncbi:O11H7 protein, partial [Polypterus senegalus]|nr:O11H7 protein [Polypterus senegalus]
MSESTQNFSSVKEFLITGFPGLRDQESRKTLFGVFLTVYLLILVGNLLLVFIFLSDRTLHTPMYILVCGLAVLDIAITTNTVPSMLVLFTFEYIVVPFAACFTQMTLWSSLFSSECFLLALMAYDRYIAICNPLHYPNLMYNSLIIKLIAFCWLLGFLCALVGVAVLLRLPFCGPNKIIHCFCNFGSLLFLACGDIQIINYVALSIGLSVMFIPLAFILFTYVQIIFSVVKIASAEGRMKAFYTCGTHMLVISVFFMAAGSEFVSVRIPGTSVDTRIMILIVQNVFPALTNPIIYCLRTKEIRKRFPGLRDQESRKTLFGVFLTVYLLILVGNLLLVFIFLSDRTLHTPMYILVCGLAVLDIAITTNTVPSMLVLFTFGYRVVPFAACFTQMTLWLGLFSTECFLLALMAYDRYIAICNPLHYPNLMYNSLIVNLIAFCWLMGFLCAIVTVAVLLRLSFCGSNKIIHCFCDFGSLLFLACGDIQIINYVALSIGLSVLFIPLAFILFTYVQIIFSVVKIASAEGRMKAFYTCGTHMLVISVFFLAAGSEFVSARIPGTSVDTRIMILIVQNVFPALTNPIIYCLRTKEIRKSCIKTFKKMKCYKSP